VLILIGCQEIVKSDVTLTRVSGVVSLPESSRVLVRGTPELRKEDHMSGRALYVKFVLLMVAAATISLALGTEPWGPN